MEDVTAKTTTVESTANKNTTKKTQQAKMDVSIDNKTSDVNLDTSEKGKTEAKTKIKLKSNIPTKDIHEEKEQINVKKNNGDKEKTEDKEVFNTITFVKSPTKTISVNDSVIDSQKNAAINDAVKDSDIQEQTQNHTPPDTPNESATKEHNLRTDPSLSAAMDAYTKEVNQLVIPDNVSKQYIVSDKNLFFDKQTREVAIDATNTKVLRTKNNDDLTIKNMLQLATANKWQSIKVGGTPEFRREAWAQASLAGIKVQGYTPTKEEKQFIQAKIKQQAEASKLAASPKTDKGDNTIEQKRNTVISLIKAKVQSLQNYANKNNAPKITTSSKQHDKELTK